MLSHLSCVQLFVTLWTLAHQAPLSMGFSGKGNGLEWVTVPSYSDLPDLGIEPAPPGSPAQAGLQVEPPGKPK